MQEVAPGAVRVGGRDVTRIPLAELRGLIGYAPQDAFLFSATVAENIAFGIRDEVDAAARDERVRRAAEAAGLAPDVAVLPDGYDTLVGERGITLSGGQRQRVALARALAAEPQHPDPRRLAVVGRRRDRADDPDPPAADPGGADVDPDLAPGGGGEGRRPDPGARRRPRRRARARTRRCWRSGGLYASLYREQLAAEAAARPWRQADRGDAHVDRRSPRQRARPDAAAPDLRLRLAVPRAGCWSSVALLPVVAVLEVAQPYLLKKAIDEHIAVGRLRRPRPRSACCTCWRWSGSTAAGVRAALLHAGDRPAGDERPARARPPPRDVAVGVVLRSHAGRPADDPADQRHRVAVRDVRVRASSACWATSSAWRFILVAMFAIDWRLALFSMGVGAGAVRDRRVLPRLGARRVPRDPRAAGAHERLPAGAPLGHEGRAGVRAGGEGRAASSTSSTSSTGGPTRAPSPPTPRCIRSSRRWARSRSPACCGTAAAASSPGR